MKISGIMKTYDELGRPSQISLMIGPALSDLKTLTETFLPKAAIDKTTFRMSELLKQRFGSDFVQQKPSAKVDGDSSVEDLI